MRIPTKLTALLSLLAIASPSSSLAAPAAVALDEVHSKIAFTASTLLFSVDGQFETFSVNLDGDSSHPEQASVRVVIDTASIDTGNGKRDDHLRNPDFFDAKRYPKIVFESTRIEVRGDKLNVRGNLSMHGKSKAVTIPFKRVQGKNGAGQPTTAFKGKLTIDRNAWGIGSGSIAAKLSLDDDVELDLLLVAFL